MAKILASRRKSEFVNLFLLTNLSPDVESMQLVNTRKYYYYTPWFL